MNIRSADENDGSLNEHLTNVDRQVRRDQLQRQIHELGGLVGGPQREEVSDVELSFLERVVSWETGPRSSHREWLARRGQRYPSPDRLSGPEVNKELWRLIHDLATARVFLERTDHLSDAELYQRLWMEVLPAECPDGARTPNDACHWDFAEPGGDHEDAWLTFYADEFEREEWREMNPVQQLPPQKTPTCNRDLRLPAAE